MDNHDIDFVTITIPKLKLYAKESVHKRSLKKRIAEKVIRKPSEASLRKYSLLDVKPLQVDSFQNDDLLYSFSLYAKKQNSVKLKKLLAIDLIEKYKIVNTDLRKRLYIEDTVDDVLAITDIDKGFYRYLNGRPLPEHIPIFKSLKYLLSKQLRLKHEVGCRRDCVINIEVNHRKELEMFDISTKRYLEQVKLLDMFISEDYNKSMECLKKWEILQVKVNAKILELKNLATDKFTIISRLIGLEYMYAAEQQQLHHFTYVTHLAPHAKKLKGDIKQLKECNAADSAAVLHMINLFKLQLGFAEENESQLKAIFFKVLNGLFFDSVGATDVLKLQVHLEFCYEKVYVDKPTSMPIFATAKALEDYYMRYSYKLDAMHNNKVKQATSQYIEKQKKILRRAKLAARELRLFGRLERALLRAHAPIASGQPKSVPVVHQPTKRRTTRQFTKGIVQKSNKHELTETEIEYLSLFTDWTKDEDPAHYIHFVKEDD
ncbi:Uncharacterized protein OBRU01_17609 [Operophtera brumata]|uniref:Uncharacterized protein n=1 Tax=Operophtera brumata TaxID=104452 RepID=A0A0L7L0J9_OPEBR|nr:Uncharacterized protein OBRU01_17609 [Operophtera brumata]